MRSSLSMPSSNTRSSAFDPALPTPTTLIGIGSSCPSGKTYFLLSWIMSIFLLLSHSAKKPPENSSNATPRPIHLHGLRVFQQTDRGGKLRVLNGRCQPGHGLGMCYVRGHFKDFPSQIIDPVHQAASAGNENSGTDIIDERFFLDRTLEQFKNLAQTQMNDGVKRLAFDFLSGKPGIVFQQNCFAGQAIAQTAAAFFGF